MLARHEQRTLEAILPTVTVMRKGSEPAIQMFASMEEIGVRMDLEDFVQTLGARSRKRVWWLRWLPIERELHSAMQDIVRDMKLQTPNILAR